MRNKGKFILCPLNGSWGNTIILLINKHFYSKNIPNKKILPAGVTNKHTQWNLPEKIKNVELMCIQTLNTVTLSRGPHWSFCPVRRQPDVILNKFTKRIKNFPCPHLISLSNWHYWTVDRGEKDDKLGILTVSSKNYKHSFKI